MTAVATTGVVRAELAGDVVARAWDCFAAGHPDASGYHGWGWIERLRATGLPVYPLVAWRDGEIAGILALARQRLWPLRARLLSLPFVNYAGLVARDEEAASALLDGARDLARRVGADRIDLRHHTPRCCPWPVRDAKVRFVLDVGGSEESLWREIPPARRRAIRKAIRAGFEADAGGAEGFSDFYRLVSRGWRDHGSPILGRRFFRGVVEAFPDRVRIVRVHRAGRAMAAGLLFRHSDDWVENPWLATDPGAFREGAGVLLYWRMMLETQRWGARQFDMGRSSPGTGTYLFKQRWGASEEPLPYATWPIGGGRPEEGRAAASLRAVWKRLPLWLANGLGPALARRIPL